ncbi:MAG: DUF72 domain-containing protein [Ignavibacteria bacterium]|nr:DUF72 domain-containing protein [Ignavibacteria bacterium]
MIYFGCSQWGYGNWVGKIYPSHAKPGKYLSHYSHRFNCVEVNSTYHDIVEVERIERWRDEVGVNFKFCPKFPKSITHDKLLVGAENLTDDFLKRISFFKENLGISFLQLHPDFAPSAFDILDSYLKSLPKDFKVSVELRPFWLEYDNILSDAYAILKENKAGLVIVDRFETIKYLNKLKLTNHSAFVRFDTYGYEIDKKRIDVWVNMIKKWHSKGLPEIYFFLHFPENNPNLEILYYAMDQFERSFFSDTNDNNLNFSI